MNRYDRRLEAALSRQATKRMPPARRDGRPLYYGVAPGDRVQCVTCMKSGVEHQYGRDEAFLNDPANSPEGDGATYAVCFARLPDNAVIYGPMDGTCRTKSGDSSWTEGN